MQPSIYGPYPYLPISERKPFAWPGDAKLALWVIPNIEFFHLDDPMPGVNNERLSGAARENAERAQLGAARLRQSRGHLALLRRARAPRHPRDGGTEQRHLRPPPADHGDAASSWAGSSWATARPTRSASTSSRRSRSRQAVHDTLERISRATGRKTVGWLGAGLAETWNTLDYLIDEGVRYVADWTCDDLPFRMSVGGRPLFSIPVFAAGERHRAVLQPEDRRSRISRRSSRRSSTASTPRRARCRG